MSCIPSFILSYNYSDRTADSTAEQLILNIQRLQSLARIMYNYLRRLFTIYTLTIYYYEVKISFNTFLTSNNIVYIVFFYDDNTHFP